ncbi:aminodeoxychorismate lyase [Geomonas sp. Red276]
MRFDLNLAYLAKASFLQREDVITVSGITHILRTRRKEIAAAILLLILIPAIRIVTFLEVSPGNGSRIELVEVGRGRPLRALAADLESRGIISSARLFTLLARFRGGDSRIKAGIYQLHDGMHPGQILAKMISGDIYQRIFALPEGYSSYQVAEMMEKRGFFKKDAFLDACTDPTLLAELGIRAGSVEGYLYPGSYNMLPGKSERDVVREMVSRQRAMLESCIKTSPSVPRLSHREILTLASMVEKEAVLPAEKPLIAAVFENRLRKGMRLQSDPTATYGVRAFGGKVTKQDIMRATPYNTYLIPGLPPGPIGNPGKEAIQAVLSHPPVPYLYFVARGDGSHQFSSDLTAHNEAVRRFLRTPGAPPGGNR